LQGLDFGLGQTSQSKALAMSKELMQMEAHEIALDYDQQRPSAAKEKALKEILYKWHTQKKRIAR
jgi:hypothetical protein